MRYAICNELFEGWPLEKTAALVAELGYQGLELAPFTLCEAVTDLSGAARSRIRRTVEDAGLSVVGLHWLLAKTEGFQLNDPAPDIRARTAQYLLALIDCCAELGGEVLIFGSPQQRDLPAGRSRAEAWKSTAEIMHSCGVRALEQGVVFCIEPLSSNETNFIVNVDEAAELVRQVDHPGFQMMVDMKAMSHDPRPIPQQIRTVHPLFQHVHLNDPNLRGPGMGDLDFQPILQTLGELNYARWLSVEVFDFTPGAEQTARDSLAYLRKF
jgi:sugar phosphate isomerase/epimerase